MAWAIIHSLQQLQEWATSLCAALCVYWRVNFQTKKKKKEETFGRYTKMKTEFHFMFLEGMHRKGDPSKFSQSVVEKLKNKKKIIILNTDHLSEMRVFRRLDLGPSLWGTRLAFICQYK